MTVSFDVIGLPSPQGSKTRMPNGAMLDGKSAGARTRHRDWRTAVAQNARDQADHWGQLDGPLMLSIAFRFPMPKSRTKAVRAAGYAPKATAPDLDKLIRAVCDGLQAGGLIPDDARITSVHATKCEVVGWTGAHITLVRTGL